MEFLIPRWKQLPGLALYMDQVLLVLGGILQPLSTEDNPMVTATMINNYVKMKLTPPPEKKKYNRAHVAVFLMICLLKKVLSMTEIASLQEQLPDVDVCYDLFCREMELRLQDPAGADSPECPVVLCAAVRAVACKLLVEQMLAQTNKKEDISERKVPETLDTAE